MGALATEKGYSEFVTEIKSRIREAQYSALKAVNKELIGLYWDIGKRITEKQEEFGWGRGVVEKLALDLQKEYPGVHGFSAANLWRMRNFYQSYCKNAKLAPLVREISWAKNLVVMEKCKNDLEREFYLRMTVPNGKRMIYCFCSCSHLESFPPHFSSASSMSAALLPFPYGLGAEDMRACEASTFSAAERIVCALSGRARMLAPAETLSGLSVT